MLDSLLPPAPLLTAFVVAAVVLAISPGPGVLFIVTCSALHGRRAGLVSVAGVALGNLGNVAAASLGLAALFAASALAFAIVRLAGALYLVFLGVALLRGRGGGADAAAAPPPKLRRTFRDACIVALLNPKTLLFFAAFLPQFVADHAALAAGTAALRGFALGTLFVAIAALSDSAYALAAAAIAPSMTRTSGLRDAGRYVGGVTLIGLGIFAATAGLRQ